MRFIGKWIDLSDIWTFGEWDTTDQFEIQAPSLGIKYMGNFWNISEHHRNFCLLLYFGIGRPSSMAFSFFEFIWYWHKCRSGSSRSYIMSSLYEMEKGWYCECCVLDLEKSMGGFVILSYWLYSARRSNYWSSQDDLFLCLFMKCLWFMPGHLIQLPTILPDLFMKYFSTSQQAARRQFLLGLPLRFPRPWSQNNTYINPSNSGRYKLFTPS